MGNHRAERRGPGRRPSDLATPIEVTTQIDAVVPTAVVPVAGKRKAVKPDKPAKLANGVSVNVPEFVQSGEKIRVNPNTGEYLDRAK